MTEDRGGEVPGRCCTRKMQVELSKIRREELQVTQQLSPIVILWTMAMYKVVLKCTIYAYYT